MGNFRFQHIPPFRIDLVVRLADNGVGNKTLSIAANNLSFAHGYVKCCDGVPDQYVHMTYTKVVRNVICHGNNPSILM